MTTSCLKPMTQTTQQFNRGTATALRSGNVNTKAQSATRRFLAVLMNSLSAWAV